MTLTLGNVDFFFQWDATWEDRVVDAIPLALVDSAEEIVDIIADADTTPEDTGALKDSIRVAPPGYAQDDLPLVRRDQPRIDPFTTPYGSLNRRATRSNPVGRDVALAAHRESRLAGGASGFDFGTTGELVEDTGNAHVTWIGSFLYYSFWVHEGFYNVRAQRDVSGRPYIAQVATPLFSEVFLRAFMLRIRQQMYRGA